VGTDLDAEVGTDLEFFNSGDRAQAERRGGDAEVGTDLEFSNSGEVGKVGEVGTGM